jgi:serine/threonine protein kinase
VIYELACGKYAYPKLSGHIEVIRTIIDRPSPTLPREELYSPELRGFLRSCLEKDPAKRPNSIELMVSFFVVIARRIRGLWQIVGNRWILDPGRRVSVPG